MKIIQEGKTLNGVFQRVRFSCPVCDSRLEEWKKDLQPGMLFNELYFGFTCPVCKGKVTVKESDLESVR